MKERPIIFRGEQVRALLAGTATQTRRVMKPQPAMDSRGLLWWNWSKDSGSASIAPAGVPSDEWVQRCPFGVIADRLWVRETWAPSVHSACAERDEDGPFVYAAHGKQQNTIDGRWRPSIHMPRYASRITLEITDVRVQRLQDISAVDCIIAEGIRCEDTDFGRLYFGPDAAANDWTRDPCEAFRELWESINGAGSWSANPWVWALTFRRVTP